MYTNSGSGPIEPGLKAALIFFSTSYFFFSPHNQKLGTTVGEAKPVSTPSVTSFFRRISSTLRWWLECNSLENVGLQAGLYSGKSRPDLYLTPHALHKVFAPSGPVRH